MSLRVRSVERAVFSGRAEQLLELLGEQQVVSIVEISSYTAGYPAFYRYSIGWYLATRPQTSLEKEAKGLVHTLVPSPLQWPCVWPFAKGRALLLREPKALFVIYTVCARGAPPRRLERVA